MVELTTILATYGAIVSTLAVGWNIYRDATDRGRLRVSCMIGFLAGRAVPDHENHLFYTVTNVGRRPITVTKLGGGQGKKYFMIVTRGRFPQTLNSGELLNEWVDDPLSVLDKNTKFLAAWDSTDRMWKVGRRSLRKLLKEAEEMRKEQQSLPPR